MDENRAATGYDDPEVGRRVAEYAETARILAGGEPLQALDDRPPPADPEPAVSGQELRIRAAVHRILAAPRAPKPPAAEPPAAPVWRERPSLTDDGIADAAFFAAHPDRRLRIRAWRREDQPSLHPKAEPLYRPFATIIERARHGPRVRAITTFAAGMAPAFADSDDGAGQLIEAFQRAEARRW